MRIFLWIIATTLSVAASATDRGPQLLEQTLTINGRQFTLPADTPVLIDGQSGVLSDLLDHPAGMQVRWQPADAGRGALPTPVFSYTLIGPVTQALPLEVLGQPLTITGDTVVEGFESPDQLEPGNAMIIAGLVDANGSLYATLAERRGAQGNKYLLSGHVQAIGVPPALLRIGTQWVDTAGVVIGDCEGGAPAVGSYMELRADSIPDFQPGDTIDTVTEARCATPVPLGTPGAQGFLEGIVGLPVEAQRFQLGPVTIEHGTDTVFEFGGPDDIEPGSDISTEGTFLDATTFIADSIEFVRPVVRFEAPMLPSDITPGISLRPFGVEVFSSAQVRDDDGILANGLDSPAQVRVRGWIDREGIAHAVRVRDRGNPEPTESALRGPVEQIASPQLTIQGLSVDTTNAVLLDADKQLLTSKTFFADVRLNHVIDISDASWNAATRTLSGGTIILLGYEHTEPVPGEIQSIVIGTVSSYGVGDPVFADGFELSPSP